MACQNLSSRNRRHVFEEFYGFISKLSDDTINFDLISPVLLVLVFFAKYNSEFL